jgi:hypothetical protein
MNEYISGCRILFSGSLLLHTSLRELKGIIIE